MTGFGSDLDVAVSVSELVGEMPSEGCESPVHGTPTGRGFHAGDVATHYAQLMHECVGMGMSAGDIYAICPLYASMLGAKSEWARGVRCLNCGQVFMDPDDWIRLVGPIGG